jgi:hypothetical protein
MDRQTFLHVFVIGSASNKESTGQIPMSDTFHKFKKSHPHIMPYLYFIDPLHRNMGDFLMLHELMKDGVPLCVIVDRFRPSDLADRFKIVAGDEVLFIDYAQIADTERAWKSLVGDDGNTLFYIAHNTGNPILDLEVAYSTAKANNYKISAECSIPKGMSKTHKTSLINELKTVIDYARLLPAHSDSSPVPEWLVKNDARVRGASMDDLFLLQAQSEATIASFFSLNGADIYKMKDTQWMFEARQLIERA